MLALIAPFRCHNHQQTTLWPKCIMWFRWWCEPQGWRTLSSFHKFTSSSWSYPQRPKNMKKTPGRLTCCANVTDNLNRRVKLHDTLTTGGAGSGCTCIASHVHDWGSARIDGDARDRTRVQWLFIHVGVHSLNWLTECAHDENDSKQHNDQTVMIRTLSHDLLIADSNHWFTSSNSTRIPKICLKKLEIS